MEQLNSALSNSLEEGRIVASDSMEIKSGSGLLNKVRPKFMLVGGVSLFFSLALTVLFYKANFGLNMLLFSVVVIGLLYFLMHKLSIPMKPATYVCYLGVVLLGLSSMLTVSEMLQFFNTVGSLLLLDISILHQFYEDHEWNFSKHLKRVFTLPFTCITTLGLPFIDSYEFLRKKKLFQNKVTFNILIGVLISIPLLGIVMLLLSSADLLFRNMTEDIVSLIFSQDIFNVALLFLFGFLACYCIICGSVEKTGIEERNDLTKKAPASIAITILTILGMVYVLFCGIQIFYLFIHGLFTLPAEFTFAEYARRGFFELVAVTAINILLILLSTTLFEESKLIRILLTGMTVCTYIMIGSAFYRMFLYIGEYQLTHLRLLVLLFLTLNSFVLAGILISVYRKKFPLFGYCVTVISLGFLVFSFAKPDYIIASYNIDQDSSIDEEDLTYLTTMLSLDAAPVVVPYLANLEVEQIESKDVIPNENAYDYAENINYELGSIKTDYINEIKRLRELQGIRDYNVSVHIAYDVVMDSELEFIK
jgi:hypothetical protein